ncbi:hypothetical protein AOLI_G00176980 [Acnodon oligacanthus]
MKACELALWFCVVRPAALPLSASATQLNIGIIPNIICTADRDKTASRSARDEGEGAPDGPAGPEPLGFLWEAIKIKVRARLDASRPREPRVLVTVIPLRGKALSV